MGTIIRSIKNITRNKSRNVAVILILTLSLSFALMMINMNFSSNQIVKSIRERIGGNSFSVGLSDEYIEELYKILGNTGDKLYENTELIAIDEKLADEIAKIPSVIEVNKYLSGSFYSEKLKVPGITAIHKYKNQVEVIREEISHTISFIGTDEQFSSNSNLLEGNIFKRDDIEQNVALIADRFAERNKLDVGSNIIIKGEKLKIIGIYEVIGEFSPEEIFIPFKTAQRLFNMEGKVDFLFVTVDSIDNVQKVVDYINNKLSDGRIKATQSIEEVDPTILLLNNIKRISKVTMISSSIVAILTILSIMFINVRERAREIGILKAIGASNFNISTQFLIESISLCIIALILSTLVTLAINQPLADFIGEREKTEIIEKRQDMLTDEEIAELPEEIKDMFGYTDLEKLKSMNLKITFFPQILIFAILLTFLLGAIGSILPAYYISKLRPAEVLRFE